MDYAALYCHCRGFKFMIVVYAIWAVLFFNGVGYLYLTALWLFIYFLLLLLIIYIVVVVVVTLLRHSIVSLLMLIEKTVRTYCYCIYFVQICCVFIFLIIIIFALIAVFQICCENVLCLIKWHESVSPFVFLWKWTDDSLGHFRLTTASLTYRRMEQQESVNCKVSSSRQQVELARNDLGNVWFKLGLIMWQVNSLKRYGTAARLRLISAYPPPSAFSKPKSFPSPCQDWEMDLMSLTVCLLIRSCLYNTLRCGKKLDRFINWQCSQSQFAMSNVSFKTTVLVTSEIQYPRLIQAAIQLKYPEGIVTLFGTVQWEAAVHLCLLPWIAYSWNNLQPKVSYFYWT